MSAGRDAALALLGGEPYRAYTYGYPHKTAYRPLAPARALGALFADEPRDALFLYLHVPFCARRCGYCNLFARAGAGPERHAAYLAAIERQARALARAIPGARFARLAVGGGTPAALGAAGLARLLDVAERVLGVAAGAVPSSVELSPACAGDEVLAALAGRGVSRVSLGVETFLDGEARAAGRPQTRGEVEGALERVRGRGFPIVNVDLIYGLPGQTVRTFEASLRAAVRHRPEELYLYPLYVRPGTPLAARAPSGAPPLKRAMYRRALELLAAEGYVQRSMRHFALPAVVAAEPQDYRCQDDGMLGLGCGARSYTRRVHWSDPYAVDPRRVAALIDAWARRSEEDFGLARHGYELDGEDERRRWAILTLLGGGLDGAAYRARFGSDASADLPELTALADAGLTERAGELLRLTPLGVELSDAVGPFLFSGRVRARMGDERAA